MRVDFKILETLLCDDDLATTSDPVSIATVAGMLTVAEIDAIAGKIHIANLIFPLVTP